MNKLPFDLSILKEFSQIDQLDNDFFQYNYRKKIWELFSRKILKSTWKKNNEYELFLNSLFFANQYLTSFIALAKNIDTFKNNHQLEFSNNLFANFYKFDKNYKFNFDFIIKQESNYSKLKEIIRNLSFKSLNSKNFEEISVIDHNQYSLEWIYSNKNKYNFKYRPSNEIEKFFISSRNTKNSIEEKNIINFYLSIVQEISQEININKSLNNNLIDFCYKFLQELVRHILYLTNLIDNKKIPKKIISNIGGFLNSRILSNRCLILGGEVLRFTHGSGIIKGNQNSVKMNELCLTSEFYVNNKNEINLGKDIYKSNNFFLEKNIKFNFFEQKKSKVIKKNKKIKKNNQLKYIYSVSNFEFYRFPGPATLHDIDYLKFQNKIVNFFNKFQLNFTYQSHPSTSIGIKKNPAEKFNLVKTNFEKHLHSNDIFVFDNTLSTTFWKAIYLKKPIILLKLFNVDERNPYNDRIKKRCAILSIKDLKYLDHYLENFNIFDSTEEAIIKSNIEDDFDLIF